MNLCFIDFETDSAEPQTTRVTDVGALLLTYLDTESYEQRGALSQLCWDESYPPLSEKIVKLTHITDEMLRAEGKAVKQVFETQLFPLMAQADYALAHKKTFDQTVYEHTAARLGLTPPQPKHGWICTLTDVPYPPEITCRKLSHLAYEHSILVDPATLHRALPDVRLLARLIIEKYPLEDIIEYRDSPWFYLCAKTRPPWEDGGASNQLAKEWGYSYQVPKGLDGPHFPKAWVKRAKEKDIPREKLAPFPITRLVPAQAPALEPLRQGVLDV